MKKPPVQWTGESDYDSPWVTSCRYGQGQCVCNTGLQGDGFSCQVIPSEGVIKLTCHYCTSVSFLVNIRGYADPDFALLDVEADTEVAVLSDLGPQVI